MPVWKPGQSGNRSAAGKPVSVLFDTDGLAGSTMAKT
jgi:hypothetical protein